MRRWFAIALLCLPTFVFAFTPPFGTATKEERGGKSIGHTQLTYQGKGYWKNPAGEKRHYSVTTDVFPLSGLDGIYVLNTYTDALTKDTWYLFFTILNESNGFASVWMDGVPEGVGYCFPLSGPATNPNKKCHMSILSPEGHLEQTVVVNGNNLLVFGSQQNMQGIVAWKQGLSDVNPPMPQVPQLPPPMPQVPQLPPMPQVPQLPPFPELSP